MLRPAARVLSIFRRWAAHLAVLAGGAASGCEREPSAWALLDRGAGAGDDDAYAVALGFAQTLPDSALALLLERHGVQPYVIHATAAGVGASARVPPARASLELLGRAREELATTLRISLCGLQGRARRGLPLRERGLAAERTLLARVDRLRAAFAEVERGDPVVYALAVVGPLPAVRGVSLDPAVAWYASPAGRSAPSPPAASAAPGPEAEVERLSAAEVRDRFEAMARPTSACEDAARPR